MIYRNGGSIVHIDKATGDRTRWIVSDEPTINPDTIDVKITNWCDNEVCVKWCHEKSNLLGKHGDLNLLYKILSNSNFHGEIALGGGSTFSNDGLDDYLDNVNGQWINNATISQFHLMQRGHWWLHNQEISAFGVSVMNAEQLLNYMKENEILFYDNAFIFHVIVGVTPIKDIKLLLENGLTVLILGYKNWGNGKTYKPKKFEKYQQELINFFSYNAPILFDNLALEQLNVKNYFTEEQWDKYYQGDDGQYSLYIDLVEQTFSLNSYAVNRYKFNETWKLSEMMNIVRKEAEFNNLF